MFLFNSSFESKDIKLIMTILVRDEADIIKENIDYHLDHGVDFLIITDNNSIDGTRDIISEYEKAGVAHIIDEPGRDKLQFKWVTRMARLAKSKYKADWVINNDADEFWIPISGNLKDELINSKFNIVYCNRYQMLPDENNFKESFKFYHNKLKVINPFEKNNPNNSNPLMIKLGKKLIHKGNRFIRIEQGNHKVKIWNKKATNSENIDILHFPIRSYSQFLIKVINNGTAYKNNKTASPDTGLHLRHWYEMYKNGKLEQEFEKFIIDKIQLQDYLDVGNIEYDDTLYNYMIQKYN